MEAIRRLVGEVIVAESALGTERVRAVDEAQSNTLYAAMAGSVLGLGGLLAGTVLLLRRNRRLREAETELSAQSASAAGHAGQLPGRASPHSTAATCWWPSTGTSST